MATRTLVLTHDDHEQLQALLRREDLAAFASPENIRALRGELARATLVPAADAPPGLVRLRSTVRLRNLTTGERMRLTLVLPEEADFERGRISVLAPLGTALLGFATGDEFTWQVPRGAQAYRIDRVEPPAAMARV